MNSRFALCLLASTLTAAAVVPAAAPATPEPAAPETAGFHLKNRSSFSSTEGTRPPFWPIGWVKQFGSVSAPVTAMPEVKFDPDQYSVTSILLGKPSLAVINGRSYAEGEFIRAPRTKGAAATSTHVQVGRITDGSVVLVAGNQGFPVPLRRPQLTEHAPEEDLPLNNR